MSSRMSRLNKFPLTLFLELVPLISTRVSMNLNGLLVICQIDNTSPRGGGVCARREISPWLSQEMRTWTHSHHDVRIFDQLGQSLKFT